MPRNPHRDHGLTENFKYFYNAGIGHINEKEKNQLMNIVTIAMKRLEDKIQDLNGKF